MHILILDIDETLVHTFHTPSGKKRYYKNLCRQHPQEIFQMYDEEYTVITRPHLQKFLIWAFDNFDHVAVWSAGQYDYVHEICDHIFLTRDPAFILTREDCQKQPNGSLYKDLRSVYEKVKWVPTDTYLLLVDDLDINQTYNGVHTYKIPAFEGEDLGTTDNALLQFMENTVKVS